MKVLILGHTGFVGRNVTDILEKNKINYKGVSKSKGGDIRNIEVLMKVLKDYKPDYIINCAAKVGSLNYVTEYAADVIKENTEMILSLYESVKEVDKNIIIINPVANCSYPGDVLIYKESEWLNGPVHKSVLSYGNSRRLLVTFADCYKMQYNIKSINLLVPNMYGAYDSTDPNKAHALNALISKFVKAFYENKKTIEIWGTGKVIREWLYAKDFARVVYLILCNKKIQEKITNPINIAQNDGLSIKELAFLINKYFENKFELKFDTSKPDGAPKKVMDDTNFRKIFKDFEFTNFDDGVKNTINYYKSIYPY